MSLKFGLSLSLADMDTQPRHNLHILPAPEAPLAPVSNLLHRPGPRRLLREWGSVRELHQRDQYR